jgi:hypothetical protein
VGRAADLAAILTHNVGFYRPVVALTFAVNYAMFHNQPLGYGMTNLALAIACAALLAAVIRDFGAPREAAIAGAAIWLLNFHGIDMAILWISGRTALVLIAASLAAALALLRGHAVLAALGVFIALLAKEEAVVLPFVLLAWLIIRQGARTPRRAWLGWIALSAVCLGAYSVLRAASGAFTLSSAPPYYRLAFAPASLASNVVSYADRALTFPALACLAAWLLLRPERSRIRLPRRALACAAVWFAGGYALTLFLPVRSSLYACFPSIGAAIAAALFSAACWRHAPETRRRRVLVASVVASAALAPVYHARARRWVDLANLSAATLDELRSASRDMPAASHIVLVDDRTTTVNLSSAYGTLVDDAYFLEAGRRMAVWIDPPVDGAALAGLTPPCRSCVAMTLRLKNGRLEASDRGKR